jgi:hypothetical protein
MSIQSGAVLVGGTVATTGGTSTSFITKGGTLDSLKTILDDGAEFIAASTIDYQVKDPKVSTGAPNGYTQARTSVKLQVPLALDNGNRTINTFTLSLSVDPETTDAEVDAMRVLAAQLIHDADFDDLWQKQSLS